MMKPVYQYEEAENRDELIIKDGHTMFLVDAVKDINGLQRRVTELEAELENCQQHNRGLRNAIRDRFGYHTYLEIYLELRKPEAALDDAPTGPVAQAIQCLSEIDARHLDDASTQVLAQLFYWTQRHTGALFVKTVGRLDEQLKKETDDE